MLEVWRAGGSNTGFSRALAEAVESALGANYSDEEEAKTSAELNAANDG